QAPVNGMVSFSTAGSGFDTTLAAYTGASLGALTTVASNNDEAPPNLRTSKIAFNATASTIYFIAVSGANQERGAVALNWSVGASIRGRVTYDVSNGMRFFIVTLDDGNPISEIRTDAFGNYLAANLAIGRNYTVTPSNISNNPSNLPPLFIFTP